MKHSFRFHNIPRARTLQHSSVWVLTDHPSLSPPLVPIKPRRGGRGSPIPSLVASKWARLPLHSTQKLLKAIQNP
jgi:hypothetical protein